METQITRDQALAQLKTYNKDPFHIHHAFTVEGVMRRFAKQLGYAQNVDFWNLNDLLQQTLNAMKACEESVNTQMSAE